MKIKTSILWSSSVLALSFFSSQLSAHAAKNQSQLVNIQVNQNKPRKNQTAIKSKRFLNQPNNSIQTTQNNSSNTNLNSQSLTDYSKQNFYNNFGYSHFTRYNLENMQNGINSPAQNPIANFKGLKISDVSTAKDTRVGYQGQQMNVWDSWPLQNAQGQEVTYNGYHIVFALAGNPNRDYTTENGTYIQDVRIYVFYQKIGDENRGIKSWKNAGPLFLNSQEGSDGHDNELNHEVAQWSGETVRMADGKMRIFYTSFPGDYNHGKQVMATAQIKLNVSKRHGVSVDHAATTDHKTILEPDGKIYQSLDLALSDNYDENAFRDAHYFEYKGKKYVIFEANSGPEAGYQGESALYNQAYLGGDAAFQKQEQNLIVPTIDQNGNVNPWHTPAKDYNAVIGIAQLNDDYTIKKIMNPLIGFNTITDEFERPNIIEHRRKWYLFGITRGYKLATPNVKSTDSFMLGFVANSPFGPYKPLNKNGLVLRNTRAWNSRYYTYSFYVLNNHNSRSNQFVVTDYMSNTKQNGFHQTFGPSFTITLTGDKARVNSNSVLPQNATTTKNTSFIQK